MGNSNVDQPGPPGSGKAGEKTKKPAVFALSPDPILDEGGMDNAHKYEAGVEHKNAGSSTAAPPYEDLGSLPATYYEDTLFLVARDPHWLFTYWDFDWTRYPGNQHWLGVARFFLKIRASKGGSETAVEIKPEARNWYVPVSEPETEYVAEIGYYGTDEVWKTVVRSGTAKTPPDALAPEAQAQFATVPQHLAFEHLLNLVTDHMREGETLLQAVSRITGEGRQIALASGTAPTWTREQRALLAALVGQSVVDRVGLGSAEIDHLLSKHLVENLQSESASQFSARFYESLGPTTSSLFSPIGASWSAQPFGLRAERGFFMHVNAEIIFYGGTQPDATVWIGGHQIQLNADGTFRYHFTLRDGEFAIPIVARSADGVETRSATLSFARSTERSGEVGDTSQPSHLSSLIGKKEAT
jgi:hypothetical protein